MKGAAYTVLVAVGFFVFCGASALAANYVQSAPVSGGASTVIVDLKNGNITICPAYSGTSNKPLGSCKNLGKISVVGVSGIATNLQISIPNGLDATITNLTNGAVMMCMIGVDNTTGQPTGSCVSGGAF